MKNPITLLDGYSLIYRAYFAFIRNPLINKEGKNVSVVFGFFNTLFTYFNKYQPARFAVVLDSRTPTFRHIMYPEYKANREKAPDDLHAQIPIVEEILAVLGIPILRQDGVEADDIIATLAVKCSAAGTTCGIITGDKDLLQLVNDCVYIIKPDKGNYIKIDREKVIENWSVEPNQILDLLSLTGDKADNIPGVKGIGEKGAAKMLQNHSNLEEIYQHLDELTPAIRKKMEEGKENAFLSRKLITLKSDLAFEPEEIPLLSLNLEVASPLFIREGVPSLAKKGKSISSDSELPTPKSQNETSGESTAPMVPALSLVEGPGGIWKSIVQSEGSQTEKTTLQEEEAICISTLNELKEKLAEAAKAQEVAFDCETDNINDMLAHPFGFSFCYEDNKAYYVPFVAKEGIILDETQVRPILKEFFETPNLKIIGQNFKYDYKVLTRWGATPPPPWADTLIAAWLIESDINNHGMDFLADRYLNYQTIKFSDIVEKKATFDTVPLDIATSYAAEDALITWRLWKKLYPLLQQGNLENLFFQIEMPICKILAKMEMEGISLDKNLLSFYSKKLESQLNKIQEEIYLLAEKEFNINSPKQLQVVLFDELKLPTGKKIKTGYSTDTSVLQGLAKLHPIAALLLRHRVLNKLKTTYTDALPQLINPQTSRIHTKFIQTGTATGRLSSRDPNLQNIPIKDEEGRMIRRAFQAAEGKIFLSADYAQIELAVLASLSGDENLCAAFKDGEDIHRRTASLIFNKSPLDITSEERRIAKTINFGVMYGMSSFRLSQELEIPMKQASAFIATYFQTYSGIREFINKTIQTTEERGYVETQGGHIRRINGINSRNKTEQQGAQRVAINSPIQGTAADIVKRAMLGIAKQLESENLESKLILQIHDELLFELPIEEEGKLRILVQNEMEKAAELSIPLKISIETGKTWGDFH